MPSGHPFSPRLRSVTQSTVWLAMMISLPAPVFSQDMSAYLRAVVGSYHHTHRIQNNDWHTGKISLAPRDTLTWTNSAGVSWQLVMDPDHRRLRVGAGNQYPDQEIMQHFKLEVRNGRVVGFWFGAELYARTDTGPADWPEKNDANDPTVAAFVSTLVGEYDRLPVQNDWHAGKLEAGLDNTLVWTNRAGASWKLTPDAANGRLRTGADSPFVDQEIMQDFTVEYRGEQLVGFRFGGELYVRAGVEIHNIRSRLSKLCGEFQRSPVERPQHVGLIQLDEGNMLRWVNGTNQTWLLTPDLDNNVLRTGLDNPFQNQNKRDFRLQLSDGQFTGFHFGEDFYSLTHIAEQIDEDVKPVVITPHTDRPSSVTVTNHTGATIRITSRRPGKNATDHPLLANEQRFTEVFPMGTIISVVNSATGTVLTSRTLSKDTESINLGTGRSSGHMPTAVRDVVDALSEKARQAGGSLQLSKLGDVAKGIDWIDDILGSNGFGADFAIRNAQFSSDGSIVGTATFRNHQVAILFQTFDPDDLGIPQWALSIKYPELSTDMLPQALRNILQAELTLNPPVFVISSLQEELVLTSADMSDVTRSFYRDLYDTPDFSVTVKPGIRYAAVASMQPQRFQLLKQFGFEVDNRFEVEGQLLESFPTDPVGVHGLVSSKGAALLEGIKLKASLPQLSVPLPTNMSGISVTSGQAYFEFSAKPSAEIGWITRLERGSDESRTVSLTCKLRLGAELSTKTAEAVIVFDMENWQDAFGITGVDLDRMTGKMVVDNELNLGSGGRSKITVDLSEIFDNPKTADFAAKFKIQIKTVIPTPRDIAIRYGSADAPLSLNLKEVARLINYMVKISHPGKPAAAINVDSLPNLGFEDFTYSFAPVGGDDDLEIPGGWRFQGRLNVYNKSAMVNAKLDWTDSLEAEIKADFPDITMEGLTIKGVKLDMLLTASNIAGSYLKLSGGIDLLGSGTDVTVDLSKDRLHFITTASINNVFTARIESDAVPGEGTWKFSAELENRLAEIAKKASDAVREAAKVADRDLKAAQQRLEDARSWQRDRQRVLAQNQAKARRQVNNFNSRLAQLENTRNVRKGTRDAAQKVRNEKQKALAKVPGGKGGYVPVPKLKFWEKPSKKWVPNPLYETAKGAFNLALGTLNEAEKAFKEADKAIAAFKSSAGWAAKGLGPHLHPEVVAVAGQVEAAKHGVTAAQQFLEGLRQGTVGGLKVVAYGLDNPPILVDSVKLSGNIAASANPSGKVAIAVKYRFLGKKMDLHESIAVRDLTVDKIASQIAKATGF